MNVIGIHDEESLRETIVADTGVYPLTETEAEY